jgi:hypothetical protein
MISNNNNNNNNNQGKDWCLFSFPIKNDTGEDIEYNIGDTKFTIKNGEFLNDKYNDKYIENLRSSVGDEIFFSQYMQSPLKSENIILDKEYVKYYDIYEIKNELLSGAYKICQSWDTASSQSSKENNYNACTTWAVLNNKYYLIDVLKIRANYPELKEILISHYKKFSSPNYFRNFFQNLDLKKY